MQVSTLDFNQGSCYNLASSKEQPTLFLTTFKGNNMYNKELETDRAVKAQHDQNQKAASAERRAKIAAHKKARKSKSTPDLI